MCIWIVMMTVYASIFSVAFISLTHLRCGLGGRMVSRKGRKGDTGLIPTCIPPWLLAVSLTLLPPLVPSVSSIITSVSDPLHNDQLVSFTWQNTDQAEYVLQLGALAVVPYIAETIIEMGLVRAFLTLLQQVRFTFRPTPN